MMTSAPFSTLKILVVSSGSIGYRHLRNLRTLGIKQLFFIETNIQRQIELTNQNFQFETATFPDCLNTHWDAVFICTPTYQHVDQALAVLRAGHPVFIEKPVAHSTDSISQLKCFNHTKIPSMVGCNMRFHPGPQTIKAELNSGKIGLPIYARLHSGSYLPDWRPGRNFKEVYSSIPNQGGGCLLDCIHEIDLATWLMGPAIQVSCHAINSGSLGVKVEDVASLVLSHSGQAFSEVHIDYVQRNPQRFCQVVGTEGTLLWTIENNSVTRFTSTKREWETVPIGNTSKLNEMYLNEISHFLNCLINKTPTTNPISEALKTAEIVVAAKRASATGSRIALEATSSQTEELNLLEETSI